MGISSPPKYEYDDFFTKISSPFSKGDNEFGNKAVEEKERKTFALHLGDVSEPSRAKQVPRPRQRGNQTAQEVHRVFFKFLIFQ